MKITPSGVARYLLLILLIFSIFPQSGAQAAAPQAAALLPYQPAAFSGGNVVVYTVSDGSTPLAGSGNEVYLEEYTPAGGVPIQTIEMRTTASGLNKPFFASGATANNLEGMLTRSTNGQYLLLTGYASKYSGLASTSAATVNRVVGRVDYNGNMDTTTALSDFASTGSPYSATSDNGSNIWISGSKGGVRYTTLGSTTSEQLTATGFTSVRVLSIFNEQLYASSSSGSYLGIETVGSGLPTSNLQTVTRLPGLSDILNPSNSAFYFADLNPDVIGLDTIYIADDSTSGGILKFSLNGETWTFKNKVGSASTYRGLTATVSGTSVTLYTTSDTALYKYTDNSGYNANMSGSPVSIANTGGGNKAFRGVALAPVQNPLADIVIGVSAPASVTAGSNFTYTINASNSGGSNASNIAVRFVLPSGVSYVSSSSGGSHLGGVVTFTNQTVNPGSPVSLTVTVAAPGASGTVTADAGAAQIDTANAITESNEGNNTSIGAVNTNVTVSTAVSISGLSVSGLADGVDLQWTAAQRNDILGFRIYRRGTGDAEYTLIIPDLYLADPGVSTYHWLDRFASTNGSYIYRIEAIGAKGTLGYQEVSYSGVSAFRIFMPVIKTR